MADELKNLSVFIAAAVDGGEIHEGRSMTPIPPGYDVADIRALMVRMIEDTAFDLVLDDFGRAPTRTALRAYVARLIGIEKVLDDHDGIVPRELRIRAIIAMSNDDAIATYGEPIVEH